ncbi:MAG: AAA family ATPase [Planctomycetes bacterium]|nr:AAA family ATPase [Planctomycetota bacterium]
MTDHRLVRLNRVAERERSFLWEGRIVLGGLTVLDGDPGNGKSGIAYDFAARVTTGRPMPFCEARTEPSGVILLQAEDSLGCDVLPNLRAAGANTDRILAYNRSSAPLTFPADIAVIEDAITEVNAKLVVIDPIASFLGVSMSQNQCVRRALAPLADLADRRNVAIVMVRHLTKSGGARALYRGAGSIAIIGAARSGLVVGDDPACEDKHHHILAQSKGNRASAGSIAYRTVLNRDGTIGVEWLGESSCSTDEIIVSAQKHVRSAFKEAIEVLREILSEGPLSAKEVIKLAADAGVAKRTLYRAKAQLDVTSRKIGGGPNAAWLWESPDGIGRLLDTLIYGPAAPRPRRDIVRNPRSGSSQR